MKNRNVLLCLGLNFMLLNTSISGSAPIPDSALKLLVNNSEIILIGVIERVVEVEYNPGYIPMYDIKFVCKILEVLKGNIHEEKINILGMMTTTRPEEGAKGIMFLSKYKYNLQYYFMLSNIWSVKDEYLIEIKKYIIGGLKLNEH